jgi:hypothetical protein
MSFKKQFHLFSTGQKILLVKQEVFWVKQQANSSQYFFFFQYLIHKFTPTLDI